MGRRKFVLPPDVRDDLIARVDAHASRLIAEHSMDPEDASELVGLLVGEALDVSIRVAGVPEAAAEPMGEEIGSFIGKAVAVIETALTPDPEKVMECAAAAMRNGHGKRAARLFKKAERLFQAAALKATEAGD